LTSNVKTPIIDEIYAGLYKGKDPRQGVKDLRYCVLTLHKKTSTTKI
jgi:glycerol-3-phosphate dehydrogenase